MRNCYKVNIANSFVFILCGLMGFLLHYFQVGNYQQAALIPFILGLLLLVMTPGIKSGNKIICRVVMVLTFIFGSIVLAMLIINMGSDEASARKMILLTLIALSSFASFGFYLSKTIPKKT